jgi:hypothetical protein
MLLDEHAPAQDHKTLSDIALRPKCGRPYVAKPLRGYSGLVAIGRRAVYGARDRCGDERPPTPALGRSLVWDLA